ncbi:unnamed protein product [Rhizoctonia solani]|uniref:Uncharacterized protein n=1 Tax=Rhizoctonia solani TaxID=456999 RepID=A0A8H3B8V4_9AGAM
MLETIKPTTNWALETIASSVPIVNGAYTWKDAPDAPPVTLLSELEEFHKRLTELEGEKSYVQVLEQGLELR